MSDPQAESSLPPPRSALPRHTTPTWEMELLISGATVFALMQVPALIDVAVNALIPRFERDAGALVLLPSIYLRSAVHALIVTFILHLATRGYWVALVGLSSVHPEGVRWERLRWGPAYLEAIRARTPPLPELVERADNRASQVFGFGIGFALVLLAPLLLVLATALLAYGLFELVDRRLSWIVLWQLVLALLFLPYFLALLVDRWLGHRLVHDGRGVRALRRVFNLYLRGGFSSFVNFPVLLFTSLFGQRRGGAIIGAAVLLLVSLSMVQHYRHRFEDHVGQFGQLQTQAGHSSRILDPQHYADQRDPGDTLSPQPFIASEVVRGDYLRLFIPYLPSLDNAAIAASCPDGEARRAQVPDAALDCLAQVYAVSLDGVRIEEPAFDRARDPSSGLRGVVSMIRIANLAPGRHELEVVRPYRPDRDRPAPRAVVIPFWR